MLPLGRPQKVIKRRIKCKTLTQLCSENKNYKFPVGPKASFSPYSPSVDPDMKMLDLNIHIIIARFVLLSFIALR